MRKLKSTFKKEGSHVSYSKTLNVIEGSNVTINATYNSSTDEVDMTIAASSSISASETIDFLAAEDIVAYKVVTSTGFIANSSTVAHRGKIIGITTATVLTGFIGTAKGFGTIVNGAWTWTIGDRIFLNANVLSTTPPSSGFIQMIGTATASDTIDIKIGDSILI
jgi:hypothetical protein